MVGFLIIGVVLIMAIAAPAIAPYDPLKAEFKSVLKAPSMKHLMGTDYIGRDVFSRVIFGSRISLEVGLIAVLISLVIGFLAGAFSGYFGGLVDTVLMRLADVFLAFPYVLGAMAILVVFGPGIQNVFLAIGILGWSSFARLARSSFITAKNLDYVEAARAVGCSHWRIITRHIAPNSFAPLIVFSTMSIAWAIVAEALLSFISLGVQPPNPSWGLMISESVSYVYRAPWMMYFPGFILSVTVFGFILLGDGLRDALDVRMEE